MRPGTGWHCPGHTPSERRTDQGADETRLGSLLEQTYVAREAGLMPADDALTKLNAALDVIGTPPQRHTDHRRLFGACALVAILLLLLSPLARSEFAASTRHAGRSSVTPMSSAVGDAITGTASGRAALPPVTVAARGSGSIVPTEGGNTADPAPAPSGTALTAGVSETPLRDLLARAGIHASDPPSGSTIEGSPPHH